MPNLPVPTHSPSEVRTIACAWAHYFVGQRADFHYSEGANRMSAIGVWPIKFPVYCDCSAFTTFVLWLSGAEDPNGLLFDHQGYTGTELSHERHLTQWAKNAKGVEVEQVQPGDLVVYGAYPGQHVAFVVGVWGPDILCVSMGQEGDPNYCWSGTPVTQPVSNHGIDTRTPRTFLRPNYTAVGTVLTPPGYAVPKVPVTPAPKPPTVVTPAPAKPPVPAKPAPKPVAPVKPAVPAKPARPTLRVKSVGPNVKYLQQKLHITADGQYGPQTAKAVMAFQKAHGLKVDGVCGPTTWAKIG